MANKEFYLEILKKLENIELLLKISNREEIKKFKDEIKKDKVLKTILEFANGSLNYTDLTKSVSHKENVAEITVKKKISFLKNNGFLLTRRKGNEVYYEKSEIFD
ncbi:MAG: hypothetical protein ACTSVV_01105 [Promethearchaeota archaeon]